MLIKQHINEVNGKILLTIEYVREHWHEWLWVFVVEGEAIPHFYLPTHRCIDRHGLIVWIIPIAPFILLSRAVWFAIISLWRDCLWAIDRWQDLSKS